MTTMAAILLQLHFEFSAIRI